MSEKERKMMKKYLLAIDLQNDFIDGSLGTEEAQEMLPAAIEKIKSFDGEVIFTKDTHPVDYLNTLEGRNLPVEHCIEGTKGWQLNPEIAGLKKNAKVFCKNTFGSLELAASLKAEYDKGQVESIELIGLCTDICVVSNALLLKAYMPEVPISVDASCCAGVTKESHLQALQTMAMCQIQIDHL